MKVLITMLTFGCAIGCRIERTIYRKWDTDRIRLATALICYRDMTGQFPTDDQGLSVLVKRPEGIPSNINWVQIMDEVPKDPWGREYYYSAPNDGDPPIFEVRGLGQDGVKSDDDQIATFRADRSTIEQTN